MNQNIDDLKRLAELLIFEDDLNHDELEVLYGKYRDYVAPVNMLNIIASHEQLQSKFNEAVEVLNKIKDGGVPPMVLANVTERMLAMCGLAEEFIASLDKEK